MSQPARRLVATHASPHSAAMAAAKQRVLDWWRSIVGDVVPIDGTESFSDGRAYCACLNAIFPDSAVPYESLDARAALTSGIERAEQLLGVIPLLDVDDIVSQDSAVRPDERCVLTYLSEWPAAHELMLANKNAASEAGESGEWVRGGSRRRKIESSHTHTLTHKHTPRSTLPS